MFFCLSLRSCFSHYAEAEVIQRIFPDRRSRRHVKQAAGKKKQLPPLNTDIIICGCYKICPVGPSGFEVFV